MKTTTMPATARKDVDVMEDVQRAIEAAPSRALLIDARRKLTALSGQRESTVEEIDRLAKDLAAGNDNLAERAKDLLASGKVSDDTISDALNAARRRLSVIEEAIAIQQRAIANLSADFSHEVHRSLKEARRPLVARIAAALKELREAADVDIQVGRTLATAGVNSAYAGSVAFPPVGADCAYDAGWLQARKAEGYTV